MAPIRKKLLFSADAPSVCEQELIFYFDGSFNVLLFPFFEGFPLAPRYQSLQNSNEPIIPYWGDNEEM